MKITWGVLALVLCLNGIAVAGQESGPWTISPATHFMIAGAAQYTIQGLCVATVKRLNERTVKSTDKWACRAFTFLSIMAYATLERHNYPEAFHGRDWRADALGAASGAVLFEW